MRVNILFSRYIFYLSILILTVNSFAQVVERNGTLYRDFQFNDDTLRNNSFTKNESELSLGDTIRLPFIKDDFIVNNFDGEYGADQSNVSAAIDGNGNYAFAWIDYRDSQEQIYAQFFNSSDQRIGSNFKVNDDPLTGNNSPFFAANNEGDFVIVWLRNYQDIMAQRFNKNGQRVGNNILVDNNPGWNTSEPSVAVSNDGSFIVMWSSQLYSGDSQVYAKPFDNSGNPFGWIILVSESALGSSSIGGGRTIAVDDAGNYCLTWSSSQASSSSKIYLQKINSSGQKVGNNILVSIPNDNSRNYCRDIVSTKDGNFLFTWMKAFDYPGTGGGVFGRIYNSNGYFVTDEFMIYSEPSASWNPVYASSDKDSTFIVLWLRYDEHYLQKIKSNGEFIGETVMVRYNSTNIGYSYNSGLTDIFDNHFFIAPEFYERQDQNIYVQKFNIDLQPIGTFDKLHDDVGSANQKKSLVKFNLTGKSIVLWEDQRNGRYDLYAQVYDENYNPIGNNLQINETNADYWQLYDKEVNCLSDGSFVIAFNGSVDYNGEISVFLQRISTTGEKIGQNKLVKEGNYYYDYKVALNVNSDDEILICWYNRYGAYTRIYDKNLNILAPEKTLLQISNNNGFNPITVSSDSAFNIFISYINYDYQNYSSDNKIRGRFFDRKGNNYKAFIIDSVNSYISNIACRNEGNNFALLYKDGTRIYIKRNYDLDESYFFENSFYSYDYSNNELNIVEFDNQKIFITYNSYLDVIGFYANDNKRETESYLLHHYEYIEPYYDNYNGSNSADIFDDKIIFTYENNSNEGTGFDIWANVRKIESVSFESELFYPPADYDILYNNFPNPFNSKTKIAYELLAYHKVNLTIYDILGREVKVLVNENQEKGLYEVDFDGAGLASGIYFYKLDAFKTTVKKMILLK